MAMQGARTVHSATMVSLIENGNKGINNLAGKDIMSSEKSSLKSYC